MYRNSEFSCYVRSCRYNDQDGGCEKEFPVISEDILTAAGFLPMCRDYEEQEGGGEDG